MERGCRFNPDQIFEIKVGGRYNVVADHLSDLERGFIRAECYHVDDLFELGSEKAIKEAGKLRSEGKAYAMQDGDVAHILFNV